MRKIGFGLDSHTVNKMVKMEKVYCARCGKVIHPYIYIKNLTHSIILNKEHLLSFCDDCLEKANLEFANGKSDDFPKKELERK